MSTASHKAIVRRYLEAVDHRNVAMLDDIVATDCIIHRPEQPEPLRGLAAFKQFFEALIGFQGLILNCASETLKSFLRPLKDNDFKEDAGRKNWIV